MRELISSTVPDAMTLQGAEVRQVVAPRVPQIARSRSLTNGEESDSSRRCRSAKRCRAACLLGFVAEAYEQFLATERKNARNQASVAAAPLPWIRRG